MGVQQPDVPEIRIGNKADCAQFFGVTLPTIDKWIRDGMPTVQRGSQGISWVIDLHAAAKWRYEARLPSGQIDPETLPPAERKLWYDGEARRRDIQERDRELIPVDEVEETVSTAFASVAQSLLSLPDLLERECALTSDQITASRVTVHAALSDLAQRISTLATVTPP
jgi:phage terminase Nu1 subunit (DNA packaging protein)